MISQTLGHAMVAFTMDVYTEGAAELAEDAAAAIAAFIPSDAIGRRTGQPGVSSPRYLKAEGVLT